MCRLCALHASQPTRVECNLVKAQNATVFTVDYDYGLRFEPLKVEEAA